MFAEEQDIIVINNIYFKPNNKLDTRITGHPVLIIKKTDTHFYFLVITSKEPKGKNKEAYFASQINVKGFTKKPINYINLAHIYKYELRNYAPSGRVDDEIFLKIMLKLQEYQETYRTDEYYSEVFSNIDTMKRCRKK